MSSTMLSSVFTRRFLRVFFISLVSLCLTSSAMSSKARRGSEQSDVASAQEKHWDFKKPDSLGRKRSSSRHVQLMHSCYRSANEESEKKADAQEVALVLAAGADPNYILTECPSKYYQGYTPLQVAIRLGKVAIARLLLEGGAEVNMVGRKDPLCLKVPKRDPLDTPLMLAVQRPDPKATELLLSYGACINVRDKNEQTPLHRAAERGYLENIRLLVKYQADIHVFDKNGNVPFSMVAATLTPNTDDMLDVLRLLVMHNACINGHTRIDARGYCKKGVVALHHVANRGNPEVIEWLLNECGVPVNIRDHHGRTPLHYAASIMRIFDEAHHPTPSLARVQMLLDEGADVNAVARNTNFRTPLYDAAYEGNAEIAQVLINAGAEVNALTQGGESPLYATLKRLHGGSQWDREHARQEDIDQTIRVLLLSGATIPTFEAREVTYPGKAPQTVKLANNPTAQQIIDDLRQKVDVLNAERDVELTRVLSQDCDNGELGEIAHIVCDYVRIPDGMKEWIRYNALLTEGEAAGKITS